MFIHKTAVLDENIILGKNISIWHFCHVMSDSKIGDNSVLGQNVMIGKSVIIGKGCKIQNNVSVYEGVELEDNVFCGPSCVFTNVINPRSFINRKKEYKKTLVKKGASIGANATIVCGVTVGSFSLIGAGAVITKDVKDFAIMAGNPAKKIGWVSTEGYKLGENLICPKTGEMFILDGEFLRKK